MKRSIKNIIMFFAAAVLLLCSGLMQVFATDPPPSGYTVVFQNWDGSEISSQTYEEGAEIVIPEDPTKDADSTYTYTFTGWDPEVVDICTADAVYVAQFDPVYIDYTVTFEDWDGAEISSQTYHYGDEVTLPEAPTREGYVFIGWSEVVSPTCAGNAVYVAQYQEETAAGILAALTGPTTVRAGDTITLTFYLSGTGLVSAEGELNYDAAQLTLTDSDLQLLDGWIVELDGNRFTAYEDGQGVTVDANTALFTVTFKVAQLAVDTEVHVSVTGVRASDPESSYDAENAEYTVAIAAPKSTVNSLKRLTVANGTLSPAFSEDTTLYTVNVPFSVTKLELSCEATDSKARVRVNNPELNAGEITKVTITVTSESGKIKVYTVSVRRESDPDYEASTNNNLSGIRVGGYVLSPGFSADCTEYVIWLPYETTRVSVTGLTEDAKASVRTEGGTNLVAGADNEIKVICTAENGEEKVYTVIAKRAPAHGTDSTQPTTQPMQPSTQPTTQPDASSNHVCPPATNIPVAMVIIPWILAFLAVAALLCVLIAGNKKK